MVQKYTKRSTLVADMECMTLNENELEKEQCPDLDELLNGDIDEILEKWLREETAEETAEDIPVCVESVEEEPREQEKAKKPGWQITMLAYLHDLSCLLAGLVLVFLLLFRVVVVSGTSMTNTLYDGDYVLLLSNTLYRNPEYGDIIVASKEKFDDGEPIIKRVIATEGQMVFIDYEAGVVYVDGVALKEDYVRTPTNVGEEWGMDNPTEVPEGCLFVMGDNRNGSMDSRHPQIGFVDKREILGKAIFLIVPGTNKGEVDRDFGRVGVVD